MKIIWEKKIYNLLSLPYCQSCGSVLKISWNVSRPMKFAVRNIDKKICKKTQKIKVIVLGIVTIFERENIGLSKLVEKIIKQLASENENS